MKAKITSQKHTFNVTSSRKFILEARKQSIFWHRQKNHFYKCIKVIALYKNEFVTVIDCKLYSTQANNYCCLWVQSNTNKYPKFSTQGAGKAKGSIYNHRESQAIQQAIISAEIELYENIGGVGEQACKKAFKVITKTLGYKKFFISNNKG